MSAPEDRPHPVRRRRAAPQFSTDRRAFLRTLTAAGITLPAFPALAALGDDLGAARRHLILIELQGGNDGLNTVVPYADRAYRRARPTIGIGRDDVFALDERLGLHPSLEPLMPLWDRGDLAIVEGVGYPDPNRSHFRSIEIWETASDADEIRLNGWLEPVIGNLQSTAYDGVSAVAISRDEGPFAGATSSSVVINDLDRFVDRASALTGRDVRTSNPELAHVLQVERTARRAAIDFAERLAAETSSDGTASAEIEAELGNTDDTAGDSMGLSGASGGRRSHPLARQLDAVARLIVAEVGPRVWKVELNGFDTHINQLRRHSALMETLGEAIGVLERRLRLAGRWNDVTLMTYSEFGRRVGENASGGTDHGTAAPQFVAGGAVHGGLHGTPIDLAQLRGGDLTHTMDFRSLYRTISVDWFGQRLASAPFSSHEIVKLFRT